MNNKKKEKKRIAAAVIAIFLALLMVLGSIAPFIYGAQEDASSQIQMELELGYSGLYRVGYPTLVKVKLTNNGAPFKGELQIRTNSGMNSGRGAIAYAHTVELPENGAKLVEMEINIGTIGAGAVKAHLYNDKNKKITEKAFTSTAVNPEKYMGAAVSDTSKNLSYLRNIELSYAYETDSFGNSFIFLEPEDMPSSDGLLSNLDYLFISNFDTARLSEDQISAIFRWVENGGYLIIGTGKNFSKTLKGMNGYLNIQPAQEKTINELEGLFTDISVILESGEPKPLGPSYGYSYKTVPEEMTEFFDKEILNEDLTLNNPIDTTAIEFEGILKSDYRNYGDIFYGLSKGKGGVILSAYDFALQGGSGEKLLSKALSYVLYAERKGVFKEDVSRNTDYIIGAYSLQQIPSEDRPTIWYIYIAIIIYSIFIGPFLYAILRKKDKREKGFIIIPVFSVSLTIFISLISLGTVYKKPILNIANVVEASAGIDRALVRSNIALLTPEKGEIRLSMAEGMNMPSLMGDEYGYYRGTSIGQTDDKERLSAKALFGARPEIVYYDNPSWSPNLISFSSNIDLGGTLEGYINFINGAIEGEIKNNTNIDIEDSIVEISNMGYIKTGAIKAGETKILGKDSPDLNYEFQSHYYEALNRYMGWEQKTNSEKWQDNMRSTLMDYYGGKNYTYTSVPGNQTEDKIKAHIYAFTSADLSGFSGNINKKNPIKYTSSMITAELPFFEVYTGDFTLDYGMIPIDHIEADNYYNDDGEMLYIYDSKQADIIFHFAEREYIKKFTFSEFNMLSEAPERLEFKIYNVSADLWEELKFTPYEDSATDYFDEDGYIKIRIVNQGAENVGLPKIRIEGSSEQ